MSKKIGIFGTGSVAQAIGAKLIETGHDVMFGTRNVENTLARTDPDTYGNPPFSVWVKQLPQAKVGTFQEAAAHGELLFNATTGVASLAVLNQAGAENLGSKILVDIANPLDFSRGMPPSLAVCNTDSLAEQIQAAFPKTKVVKTLNTMGAAVMVNPALVPGDHNVFVSGDDAEAKAKVSGILSKKFSWKPENIIDLGGIATARGTEMLLIIWVQMFGMWQHPFFNFHIAIGGPPQQ